MEKLHPDGYYHIYNRAVGSDYLFLEDENSRYFLEKSKQYLLPILDIYAYILMQNHFHFVVKIKDEEALTGFFGNKVKSSDSIPNLISRQFSNLFNGYTQAFNKRYARRGTLFQRPFKRKEITTEDYLRNSIIYVHRNAVHHNFVLKTEHWDFTSYHSYLTDDESFLPTKEVMDLFDDLENFKYCHYHNVEIDFSE